MKGEKEMLFYDIESGDFVTLDELQNEFLEMKFQDPDTYNYSFSEYIENCLTKNNGTLEIV